MTGTSSVVHVYVKAGQSNALGGRNPPYTPAEADKYVRLFPELGRQRKEGAYPLRDRNGALQDSKRRPHDLAPVHFGRVLRAGPEISFGRLLYERYGREHNTTIAKFAVGGSSLRRHWMQPGPGRLCDRMMGFLQDIRQQVESAGNTFKVSAFTWMQGETDAKEPRDADSYFENLNSLIGMVRTFAGNGHLPVIISRTRIVTATAEAASTLEKVRRAQEACVMADRCAALVDLDDLKHTPRGTHFAAREYARMGEREFDALMRITANAQLPELALAEGPKSA